ncbi:MAG TPA: PqiC family protein [Steroidobacteraceae bacterium]|nr:PqiC family protein [Steroidobacteraceae bacterium]
MAAVCFLGLVCACASSRPDHFYVLSPQPPGVSVPRTTPATQVLLQLTLPSWLDRPQMILDTSTDAIVILEHERWAAPLGELAAQTLARDIERRRGDLLVNQSGSRTSGAAVKITVDVVQISLHRGARAGMEAHWRILESQSGRDQIGGEVFSAPLSGDGSAAVASALSECVGLLADRLVGQIR